MEKVRKQNKVENKLMDVSEISIRTFGEDLAGFIIREKYNFTSWGYL